MERNELHGEKFEAIGIKYENRMEIIKEALENGFVAEEYIYNFPDKNCKLIPLMYPKSNAVQICSLLINNIDNKDENSVESFFPFLEGIENKMIIQDKITWSNNIEGEIEVESEDGNCYSFFAPFYKYNFSNCKIGDYIDVYLSGLAYYIENAKDKYKISKGPYYEMELKKYLNDNPKKTKKDFPYATIYAEGSVAVIPTAENSLFEYRGKVLDLEYVKFLNKKLAKIKVGLERLNDKDYDKLINVYILENKIKKCNLEIGNDIRCLIWLTGYSK